jgi:hypothetical protein
LAKEGHSVLATLLLSTQLRVATMKKLMITGGLVGFTISVAFGILKGSTGQTVLWHACVAAAVSGFLFRWWGQVWIKSLQQAHFERLAAAARAEAASTPAKP